MAQNGAQPPYENPPYEMPAELIKWPPHRGMSLAGGGHPPGGRCLAVCYCRKCPHYKPLPKTTRAPAKRGSASTKRMAESWKTREEPTWIDKQ